MTLYRTRLEGGPKVWEILLLLLFTNSAWPCLQHSRSLGTTFKPSPVQVGILLIERFKSGIWKCICSFWRIEGEQTELLHCPKVSQLR